MTGNSLSVAIVGAGRMGGEHAAAIRAAGDIVRWVVDPRVAAASALADSVGAAGFDDLDDLLASTRPDAVVIASPSDRHLSQALACVGRPILLEKPPWVAGQDPGPLIDAASAARSLVAVGMTTRFDPAIRGVQQAVRSGAIGEVLSVHDVINFALGEGDLPAWYHAVHRAGGGIVQTNGVHSLDRVCWLLDAVPDLLDARAWSTQRHPPIEDSARLHLQHGTVSVVIDLLWSAYPPPPSRLQIIGTRGAATAFADGSWQVSTVGTLDSRPAVPGNVNLNSQWRAFRSAALRIPEPDLPAIPEIIELLGPMSLLERILERIDRSPGHGLAEPDSHHPAVAGR